MAILTGLRYGIVPTGPREVVAHRRQRGPLVAAVRHPRLRSLLAAAQIAVTMVLLIVRAADEGFVRVMSRIFGSIRIYSPSARFPPGDSTAPGTIDGLPYSRSTVSPDRLRANANQVGCEPSVTVGGCSILDKVAELPGYPVDDDHWIVSRAARL
jgi:hypothetical protein